MYLCSRVCLLRSELLAHGVFLVQPQRDKRPIFESFARHGDGASRGICHQIGQGDAPPCPSRQGSRGGLHQERLVHHTAQPPFLSGHGISAGTQTRFPNSCATLYCRSTSFSGPYSTSNRTGDGNKSRTLRMRSIVVRPCALFTQALPLTPRINVENA